MVSKNKIFYNIKVTIFYVIYTKHIDLILKKKINKINYNNFEFTH